MQTVASNNDVSVAQKNALRVYKPKTNKLLCAEVCPALLSVVMLGCGDCLFHFKGGHHYCKQFMPISRHTCVLQPRLYALQLQPDRVKYTSCPKVHYKFHPLKANLRLLAWVNHFAIAITQAARGTARWYTQYACNAKIEAYNEKLTRL